MGDGRDGDVSKDVYIVVTGRIRRGDTSAPAKSLFGLHEPHLQALVTAVPHVDFG